jgi:curved DNA-binding protein
LTLKEGIQNGTKVKLKVKGLPKYKEADSRGDLYVTHKVAVLSKLSRKQKERYEELLKLED